MRKDDQAWRKPTTDSVKSLNMKDVNGYYKHVFRPDMTTIVVIGNINPAKAKTVIEKYFGSWKATGNKPNVEFSPVPLNKSSETHVPDANRVQDRVVLAENLNITRSNPDYYALEVGNHVLGGAFYATRLYRDLRENSGLVYYVSSSFNIGKHRSTYVVNYACDPPNVSKAKAIVVRDLKQMQKEEVTSKELRQAKALLLRQMTLSESSIDDIAGGLLNRSLAGLPLDEPTIAANHYISLKAGQVKAAFTKWVEPGNLVRVTLGPNPK